MIIINREFEKQIMNCERGKFVNNHLLSFAVKNSFQVLGL